MADPTPAGKAACGDEERVLFPLWAKLGLLFGGLVGLAFATLGWLDFKQDLARERAENKRKLMGFAEALALGIDGDVHRTFRRTGDMERPEYRKLVHWLARVVETNRLKWAGTLVQVGPDRWAYAVDSSDEPLPPGYPIFDFGEEHLRAYQGHTEFIPEVEDEWGRWDMALAPIRDRAGQVVGLIELDADADARLMLRAERTRRLAIGILIGVLLAFTGSVVAAGFLNRHLRSLTHSARALRAGNFDREVDIHSRDEIGLLGRTFNSMVQGLREREFIRETFGRYVTGEVVARILADPSSLRLGGDQKKVTVLMSDLRGFTSLSERLGPEQMVALLNRYFSRMAEVIIAHDGTIDEFAGDGIVALFGAPTTREDDALRAVACSVAMQLELCRFNADEGHALEMGIGINTGMVIAGNIGSEKRMKYGVVGTTINLAARLESFTVGSQVLIGEATYREVTDHVQVSDPVEFVAKGLKEPVRCYYLQRVAAPYDLEMPAAEVDAGRPLEAPAACFRIAGKQVEAEPLPGSTTWLTRHTVRLITPWEPEPMSNLKLRLRLQDGQVIDELYGKVTAVEPVPPPAPAGQDGGEAAADPGYRLELRITSLPEPEREMLERLLEGG